MDGRRDGLHTTGVDARQVGDRQLSADGEAPLGPMNATRVDLGCEGGGGLGDLAIRYGYQRFQMDVMLITVVVLIVMVQSIQSLGDYFSKKLNKNKL